MQEGMDVVLPAFEDAIRDPLLLALCRHWDERRGDRSFPALDDLDRVLLASMRDWVSIIEVCRDPLRFHYRFVSAHLGERLGYDMTGKSVDEIPDLSMRRYVSDFYARALERHGPMREQDAVLIDRHLWHHETMVLPCASDGETIDVLLIHRDTLPPDAAGPADAPAITSGSAAP